MENERDIAKRLVDEARIAKNEIKKKIISYIAAAFGLVAGLAWNDAVKSLIDHLFPIAGGGVAAKFVYAVLVTVLVVMLVYYLERIFSKKEEKK
jgi:uncharacterized protein (DUF697 family)